PMTDRPLVAGRPVVTGTHGRRGADLGQRVAETGDVDQDHAGQLAGGGVHVAGDGQVQDQQRRAAALGRRGQVGGGEHLPDRGGGAEHHVDGRQHVRQVGQRDRGGVVV